ncbi:MAG: EAL domain-containing protein [Desulfovibrio sp.]|jgi:diguanylate cyclase (GGDEF)-like protein|nr:EAL domain-containing protein [Desulfovibrio sp.]
MKTFARPLVPKKKEIEVITDTLRCLLSGKADEATMRLSPQPSETQQLLLRLCRMYSELNRFANEIASGNFSAETPPRDNFLAMSLKNLQARFKHVTWQMEQVRRGDYSQKIDYLGEFAQAFNQMTQQIKRRHEELEYLASHDSVTGLLNRKFFMRWIYNAVAKKPDKAGILLCCGLDNLKYINNIFGRDVGDKYIQAAANIYRMFEIVDGTAARLAGDEFGLYVHGFDKPDKAVKFVCDFMEDQLKKQAVTIDGINHKLRFSIGYALYPDDASSIDDLLRYASHTLYEVKKNHRGSVARFDHTTYSNASGIFCKLTELESLLDEGGIHFVFQPIINMADGSVFAYEALMRSQRPNLESPLDILDTAATQAKLYPLEKLTFEVIFGWIYDNCELLQEKKIFFNIISDTFLNERALTHIHPDYAKITPYLVFEILESSTTKQNFIKNVEVFRKRFNCMIAIDDYGTGYSTPSRLLDLNADIVKIDRFFIQDIHLNPDKQNILQNIIALCRLKNIKTLAEGVEQPEELGICAKMGINYAQGYYFADPDAVRPYQNANYSDLLVSAIA